ncbi:MAG: HAD family hydrolase [Dehalococcoidia bacterium]
MTSTDAPIRALILDLGNVLIHHDNDRLYRDLADASAGEPAVVLDALRSEGVGRMINTTDGPPSLVYEAIAPAIGFRGDLVAFSAIWNGIFTPYAAMTPIIEALRGRVRLLVLSNTNAMHMDYIRAQLPVLDAFDAVLTSYELGMMKPEAAIYRAALSVAGVAPEEAAFFDDVLGHVEGARAAGIRGFLFTDARQFVQDLTGLALWPVPGDDNRRMLS